jgi:hypothetical protein
MNEPHTIQLSARQVDPRAYQGRYAQEGDYSRLITAPTVGVDAATGEVVLVYLAPLAVDTHVLVDVLRHMDVPLTDRMSGMVSRARVFGYRPRNPIRNPDCAPAALSGEDPTGHAVVCAFAEIVAGYYREYAPALYARHQQAAQSVLPQWTLEGTAFTSGIVNRDGQLPYHYDSGNFKGVWSGMLGFRRNVQGGYLSIPGYDLGFAIADRSLLLFDGQAVLHGVTPMTVGAGGYRFTVVYYSLEQMWQCLPPGEEAQRRSLHA